MAPAASPLESWTQALAAYARALADYVEVVGEPSRAASRAAIRGAAAVPAELAAARAAAAALPPAGAELAAGAFALFGRLGAARAALDAGAAAALDPALLGAAAHQMSRTYVEGAGRRAAALRAARPRAAAAAAAAGEALAAGWAPPAAGADPAALAAAYAAGAKTAAGAGLFAGALAAWRRGGVDVAAFAERAKDEALGAPPDTPAAAAAALAARAGMHPLQAMELTFGLVPAAGAAAADPAGAAVVVDATLPQATSAVRYDIAPLVDARAAAAFGPLASIFTGLNFNLARRLRTITEEAVPAGGPPPAVAARAGGRGVVRTIDRGASFQALEGPLPAAAYAAVAAGPAPRVARLGALLEEAVFGAPAPPGAPRALADPGRLRADFDGRPPGAFLSLDELGELLAAGFARGYDAGPPESAEEFRADVVGGRRPGAPGAGAGAGAPGAGPSFRSYIAAAVAAVSGRGAEERLLRREAAPGGGGAALFGSAAAAAAGGRQEVLLTTAIQLRVSVAAAHGLLARAFELTDAAARAREIFADPPGGVARGGAARRLEALSLHRAVVAEALFAGRRAGAPGVVEKAGTIEPEPSLKLFVLERGAP